MKQFVDENAVDSNVSQIPCWLTPIFLHSGRFDQFMQLA
jgi:hypothetical protein